MGRKYRQWTIEDMRKEAFARERTTLLSGKYDGVMAKYTFKCCHSSHPAYSMLWSNFFYNGQRCPECKKAKIAEFNRIPYEKVKKEIEVDGYKLLSREYKNAHTKLQIMCPEEHIFGANRDKFVNGGHRCPVCYGTKKLTIEEIKGKMEALNSARGYRLLSRTYRDVKTKLKFECPKHHVFWMTWSNFSSRGCRCYRCNESKGEKVIALFLDRLGIEYVREYKIEEGVRLKLDFYIPSLSVGIECDGEHHFRPTRYGGMSQKRAEAALVKQKQRDTKKEQLCQKHDINLIRIVCLENFSEKSISKKIALALEEVSCVRN